MAIKLTTTKQAASLHGLKMLIHGPAGSGKTTLAGTITEPAIMISAESGLLPLRDKDIDVIEVRTIDDINESYEYIKSQDKYKWLILDSISEIAETVLAAEFEVNADGRKAYGEMYNKMMILMRSFRDLKNMNVVFTAKQALVKDEDGITLRKALMPGNNLQVQIPYLFDLVFALRIEKNQDNKVERYLQTCPDHIYDAKDRSGVLDMYEAPNLQAIADKIRQSINTNEA